MTIRYLLIVCNSSYDERVYEELSKEGTRKHFDYLNSKQIDTITCYDIIENNLHFLQSISDILLTKQSLKEWLQICIHKEQYDLCAVYSSILNIIGDNAHITLKVDEMW